MLNHLIVKWGNLRAHQRALIYRVLSLFDKKGAPSIVVLGNQKSGTSVIAALLAKHLQMSATMDMPAMWLCLEDIISGKMSFETFAEKYAAYFRTDLIKEPWLTFFSKNLHQIFPKSSYVLVIRDPRSNIRSILDRFSVSGNLNKNPEIIKKLRMKRGWREIFEAELQKKTDLHYIDILSKQWIKAAYIPIQYPNIDFHIIRYEDFLKDKVDSISNIAKNLGMQGSIDVRNYIDYQFQPKGKSRNTPWLDFFGKENLKRIEKKCKKMMIKYGYDDFRI